MFASPAYAQAAGAAAPTGVAALLQFVPYIAIFAIFYVLMIRPQQRRAAEHRAMIEAVKKGDEVVTAGGLVGTVVKVDENYAELEIAKGVRVRAVKNTIGDVISQRGSAAAND